MIHLRSWRLTDGPAAQAVLATAASELVMRELYHRVSAEALGMLILFIVWLVITLSMRIAGNARSIRARRAGARIGVLVAVATAIYFVAGTAIGAALNDGTPMRAGVAAGGVLAIVGAAWCFGAADERWVLLRRAFVIGCVAFVASQPLLATLRAPRFTWPSLDPAVTFAGNRAKVATLFVLLDELNAREASHFTQMLAEHGLQVQSWAIPSVGDGTSKVIPAMFTGRDFEQAKPCSVSAICSGSNVLDFAAVSASRPDIDVVGYYHPYCAIRGLRSCARLSVTSALGDFDRWQCAAWRRTGFPSHLSMDYCGRVYNRAWSAMTDAVVEALWQAPVWRDGGFLYAHIPLPHPPGTDPRGSLEAHYRANVERAVQLVNEMARRAERAGIEPHIVIFSDHPLRQANWCRNYAPYRAQGCTAVATLEDTRVPLIVAGKRLPDLTSVANNGQIFNLAKAWP